MVARTGRCASCGQQHAVEYRDGRWTATPCRSRSVGVAAGRTLGKQGPSEAGSIPGAPAISRPGLDAEVALAEALNAAGIYGWEPQHEWCEGRKYRADVAFPKQRVLVEVVGRAHLAGGEKLEADCERTAIAASKGWLVVTVTKKTIASGKAVEWVARALSRREES